MLKIDDVILFLCRDISGNKRLSLQDFSFWMLSGGCIVEQMKTGRRMWDPYFYCFSSIFRTVEKITMRRRLFKSL